MRCPWLFQGERSGQYSNGSFESLDPIPKHVGSRKIRELIKKKMKVWISSKLFVDPPGSGNDQVDIN
jgi:hypothetical protein